MFKRITSLQATLLLHELSFVLLLLVTASVAVVWSVSWQKSSEESLRLGAINSSIQNVRGELYRQLKEVFDASFLHDADAEGEYQQYTQSIRNHFSQLNKLATEPDEIDAINLVAVAYHAFYRETVALFAHNQVDQEQRNLLEYGLEHHTFNELEQAFYNVDTLLRMKQTALQQSKEDWSDRLRWMIPVPFLIAFALLLVARRFVKLNVVKPLTDVMAGAKLISRGEFEYKIGLSGVKELVQLSKTINQMAIELASNRDKLIETKKQAALADLIPLVAHNIRNPLAGIRAASQVARDETNSDETRETLTDIMLAVDRLEHWVSSLLSYLHPMTPHLSETKLTKVVDHALALIELQLADSGISIIKQGWIDDAVSLCLDCHLYEQAIFNLIQNAIEASSGKDQIQISYHQSNQSVSLEIQDHGSGMTFDPVSEQVMSGQVKQQSCGLGIPFAMKIIKQHGGKLEYKRHDHGGTSAIITMSVERT